MLLLTGLILPLAGCQTPEQQIASDQDRCRGFGFVPGTDAFADCMMQTADRRDDRRAAAARQAEADDALARAQRERRDALARDAWDRRTGQGTYASPARPSGPPPAPPSPPAATDLVRRESQNVDDALCRSRKAVDPTAVC
jgi:hypothetical protein